MEGTQLLMEFVLEHGRSPALRKEGWEAPEQGWVPLWQLWKHLISCKPTPLGAAATPDPLPNSSKTPPAAQGEPGRIRVGFEGKQKACAAEGELSAPLASLGQGEGCQKRGAELAQKSRGAQCNVRTKLPTLGPSPGCSPVSGAQIT